MTNFYPVAIKKVNSILNRYSNYSVLSIGEGKIIIGDNTRKCSVDTFGKVLWLN